MNGDDSRERRELQDRYARQRVVLGIEHKAAGVDVFVSPFEIIQLKGGAELSYSTWPEGVNTWLPKTDCVALTAQRAGELWFAIARWDDIESVCPGIFQSVPGQDPERVFPTG